MRFLFTFLTLFVFSIGFGQTIIEKKINSIEFGRDRTLKIHLPEGYKNDTIKKYPLAIVLDNDYLFDLYVGNSKVFAESDLAPAQIVVGIDTDFAPNQDVSVVKANGGLTTNSKKFYTYIKKQVIPYLETNLKTSPFLTIIGHEKAGNFLTHFLKEPEPIFNAYIAISPTFTENTLNLFSTFNLKRFDNIDNKFYLYVSNNNVDSQQEKNLYSLLKEGIQNLQVENLDIMFDNFDKSPNLPTAISVPTPHALSQIFRLYARISKEDYQKDVKELAPLDAIQYVEDKYLDIDYIYGTNLNVRLQDILAIESIVMDQQDGDYLRVLGDFTMIKHPDSPLGDFYFGMFYELGKDYERADSYYKTGYGKMDPSDPNTDKFYKNIERIQGLIEANPKEESLPLEEPLEEETPEAPQDENKDDE